MYISDGSFFLRKILRHVFRYISRLRIFLKKFFGLLDKIFNRDRITYAHTQGDSTGISTEHYILLTGKHRQKGGKCSRKKGLFRTFQAA